MIAEDIMTRDVITVREHDLISDVCKLFAEKNISGAPVVNDEGKLMGIISEGDLIYKQKPFKPPVFITLFDGMIPLNHKQFEEDMKKMAGYRVSDMMTRNAITASPDTDVSELASIIIEKKVNRLPIVDVRGHVVGVVSRHDLVKAMVQ